MVKRIFTFIYVIAAAIISIYSTIAQTRPALYIIELLTVNNKYPVTLTLLLTFLALVVPLFIVLLILNRINSGKSANIIRSLKPGETGVIVYRKGHLMGYAQDWEIIANSKPAANIGASAHVFVPLQPGTNTIMIKGGKRVSPELNVTVEDGKVTNLETGVIDDKIRSERFKVDKDSLYLVNREI